MLPAFRKAAPLVATVFLAACASSSGLGPSDRAFQSRPGQGQYVQPDWLRPAVGPRIPAADPCNARLYQTLVGVHEGAIYLSGLPGAKRIIRPALFEGPENDFLNGEMMGETYVQVQDYLPGQAVYAPQIGAVTDAATVRAEIDTRLTIRLDRDGYVQDVECG